MQDLQQVMQAMGYQFHNPDLLAQALTHPSMKANHNQRLEFLGDAVLEFIMSDILYHDHPEFQEGNLTHLRALLVCEDALSPVARSIGLGEALRMDHGEEITGGRTKPSVLCDAMEAVLAAVYLDGGLDEARALVHRLWPKPEDVKRPMQDAKSTLQEILQQNGAAFPVYEILGVSGPQHDPSFEARVSHDGKELGRGKGRTKKEAEKAAALQALKQIRPEMFEQTV